MISEEKLLIEIIDLYSKGITNKIIDYKIKDINNENFYNLINRAKMCGIVNRLIQNNKIKNMPDKYNDLIKSNYNKQSINNDYLLNIFNQVEIYLESLNINYICLGNIVVQNNICGIGHISIDKIEILLPKNSKDIILEDSYKDKIKIIRELAFINLNDLFINYNNIKDIYYNNKYLSPDIFIIIECYKLNNHIINNNFNETSYIYLLNIILQYKAYINKSDFINIINKTNSYDLCFFVFKFINDMFNYKIINLFD